MKVQECIKERDKDKLFEYFTEDIRVNNKEETMMDIDRFFDHIDEKMEFYRYNSGGLQATTNRGETLYYICTPEIYLKTDTGKKYVIQFSFNHKWAKHPEREGIETIWLIEGEEVDLGKAYKFGKIDPYDEDIY